MWHSCFTLSSQISIDNCLVYLDQQRKEGAITDPMLLLYVSGNAFNHEQYGKLMQIHVLIY